MFDSSSRRPASTTPSRSTTQTPPPSATALKPGPALPAAVRAEIAKHTQRMRAAAGKPDAMAMVLDAWLDAHTVQQPMNQSVTANLGPAGSGLKAWQGALANALAPALLGKTAAQDMSSGVTRRLTRETRGFARFPLPRPTTTLTRPALDPQNHTAAVLKALLLAIPIKDRAAVAAAYAKRNGGKTLSATLGELIRDTNVRAPLMALIPPPVNTATLTFDAFLEQLSVGMVYSNQTAAELNADPLDERRRSNPAAILSHFGYRAGPPILGRWGFQMRVFTPIPGKARWPHAVVSFRGTEGVQLDVDGAAAAKKAKAEGKSAPEQSAARSLGREGTVDTIIGDASPAQVGWLQVQPNQALIRANLGRIKGKAISTGHSLGGAIAQLVAVMQPESFDQVVTFQAANIDKAQVDRLRTYNSGQGKADPVTARHYRVEGDIVPTAGEQALDGQIYYFDRVSRPAGSAAPFGSTALENVSAGHVTPMLSTYVRGLRPTHPDLQVIANQGLRDEAAFDPKGARQVQSVFAGSYSTAQDPRLVTEQSRKSATSKVPMAPGTDPFEATVYANIAYNTLLSHVEDLLHDDVKPRLTTFMEFRAAAERIFTRGAPLSLDPDDVALARILKLDHTEKDYDVRPLSTSMGIPVYPMKATPIVTYLKDGVNIPPPVTVQVRNQLPTIWASWRGP